MTTKLGSAITARVIGLITATSGVNASLSRMNREGGAHAGPLTATQVCAQNVAADIDERSHAMQYPSINVYCEKVVNSLEEKFRGFSGKVQIAIEVRHSQDRLEGLQEALEEYADALMQVLNNNRGDWGAGLFYCGEYQTSFGTVKRGGKNFIQAAKTTFEIGVSRN